MTLIAKLGLGSKGFKVGLPNGQLVLTLALTSTYKTLVFSKDCTDPLYKSNYYYYYYIVLFYLSIYIHFQFFIEKIFANKLLSERMQIRNIIVSFLITKQKRTSRPTSETNM